MSNKVFLASVLSISLLTVSACTTSHSLTADQHDQSDTFETYNRAMFKFNYQFNKYVMKPLTRGYRAVTNQYTRDRVSSALSNLKEPLYAANHLLQGDIKASGLSVARFAVNSTLGLAGTYDVAGGWGWKRDKADFDSTLAKWCIDDGPYLILPFYGPSTPRAAVSLLVDSAANPLFWATYNDANVRDKVMYSYTAVSSVVKFDENLELLDDLERNSVDFYATMKSAYMQNRKNMGCINDSKANDISTYDFDFDIEDEDQTN